MKMRKISPMLIYIIVMFLIMSWASKLLTPDVDAVPYSQIVTLFRNEQVRSFTVEENIISLKLHSPYNGSTTVTAALADSESFRREMTDLFLEQTDSGVLESYNFYPESGFSPYELVLPLVVVGVILLFVWAMLMGRMNSSNPL